MDAAHWSSFFRTLVGTALVLSLGFLALILVADPYQNVPFSPDLPRAPVDTNQRFSYPAIARSGEFDSAVIGTSTTRLFDPQHLDALLDARFANLSMNGATAWEQRQIFDLFNRHHPRSRYLLFGIDLSWCRVAERIEKFTFRLFPEWMYDEDPWNDLLYLFNDKALENAVRELEYLAGAREAKYEPTGFRVFLPDEGVWDRARVREKIYGAADFDPESAPPVPSGAPTLEHEHWHFPSHALMREMLAEAPPDAVKVLLMVPYHEHYLRRAGERMSECKGRLVEIAEGHPNAHVLDFMIPSRITSREENYWDILHHDVATARRVARLLARALAERRDLPGFYRYLARADVRR